MSKSRAGLYPNGTVGLGILSWRGAASLQAALRTYRDADFFSLFDETLIFLPDPDTAVQEIAAKFPLRIESAPENRGIMYGMQEIAERLPTDYIFFTENDCPLLESRGEAKRQIGIALDLLARDRAVMARMRHVREYGETFDTIDKYRRYFPHPDTKTARMRRWVRPGKARRLSGTAIYGSVAPERTAPRDIEKISDGFYLVDCAALPWTNQSILIKRDVFLGKILPFCESVPFDRGINGMRSIEIELNNSKFWTQSGWKIACGPGLLTHRRANDRGY